MKADRFDRMENRAPIPAAEPLCQCDHPREAHGPQDWPRGQAGCRARVITADASWPCPCHRYRP